MKQLNITDLQNFAIASNNLGYDDERAWRELKDFYLHTHNTTIPECGIKQVFINILKTLRKNNIG